MNEFAPALELLRKRQEEYLGKARAIQLVINDLAGIAEGGAELDEKKKETGKKTRVCLNCGKLVEKFKYCDSKCRQQFFNKKAKQKYASGRPVGFYRNRMKDEKKS